MKRFEQYTLGLAPLLGLGALVLSLVGSTAWAAGLAVGSTVAMAIGFGAVDSLRSYRYTIWILVAIVCGLVYPEAFLEWGSVDLRNKWLILGVVQLVMFGMGTQMSISDFRGIRSMGKGVLVGILCQFSIMPVLGFILTRIFEFDPEIAAGIVLIGSCSSGLASNVMVYIAKANLTLSVTLTAVATLIAPLMTPLLMKTLAGTYIEIHFVQMCFQIVKIVIAPIGAALLAEHLRSSNNSTIKSLAIVALVWLIFIGFGGWGLLLNLLGDSSGLYLELVNFIAGATVFGWLYFVITSWSPKVEKWMPLFSMFGIVYFTLVTTAASQQNIISIGLLLLVVAIIHNALGYTMGYYISRLLRINKNDARTIALEVGLQNGGMASGLAGVMGKLATLGLASAIFSPWMNVSGSLLANYWKRKS